MSAAERRKGADYERAAVRWLREHGWPDARRYLAGDGRQPGDLDAVPGVTVDVKARNVLDVPGWLRQVEAEAGPARLPVLWVWRPGLADPGDWWAITRWRHLAGLLDDRPLACHASDTPKSAGQTPLVNVVSTP